MFKSQSAKISELAISAFIFLLTLTIYLSCRDTIPVSDSRWAVYVALSIVREGNTTLDEYADVIADHDYYGVLKINGHLHSLFPLGTPLLTVPILFAADMLDQSLMGLDLYEHMRLTRDKIASNLELASATLIAALTCVVIYWIGRIYLNRPRSLILVLIFALGTSMWSTASRGLWQHGPSALMLSISLYLLLAAEKKSQLAQFASLPLAFSYVIRPTNSISILFLTLYVFIAFRPYFVRYMLWAALIAIPFLLSNLLTYGKIFSPYYMPGRLVLFNPTFGEALAGNLISPSRGLLVYSPIVLFGLYGLFLKIKDSRFGLLDATLVFIIGTYWVAISSFPHWHGGHSYGPRFFTDMVPYLVYFLIPVLAAIPWPLTPRAAPAASIFIIFLIASVLFHWRGAVDPLAAFEWNWAKENVVAAIDDAPQRVWDWSDPQFLRGLRQGRITTLENSPFLIAKVNVEQTLQLTVINMGDQKVAVDFTLPRRVKIKNGDDAENFALPGMSSRAYTFSIDTIGFTPGEYSLGGIRIDGQNDGGRVVAGSPLIVPVSARILPGSGELPKSINQEVRLPIVFGVPDLPNRFQAPADLLINGQSQLGQQGGMRAVFGTGWYDLEQFDEHRWRWASSPAEITIFSPAPRKVTINSTAVAIAPDPRSGSDEQGMLYIMVNNQSVQQLPTTKNRPFVIEVDLEQGWNVITFELGAGNFRPTDRDPSTWDARELSFAVKEINIIND